MAVRKFVPAIAAGDIVVLKPGDTTPVWTRMLAEMAAELLPDTGFNHSGHGEDLSPRGLEDYNRIKHAMTDPEA